MKVLEEPEFRRTGRSVAEPLLWSQRWYGRLALLSLSVALLTLSYAPIKQCYLAWVGLVPWLIVIARCRSYKSAIFWGWLSGTMFFIANMWWMAYVTFPGMVGLMAILAAYWGVMAAVVKLAFGVQGSGFRDSSSDDVRILNPGPRSPNPEPVLLTAFAWTALEFIRGNFIWKGLPWLYLGHTQTPILAVCQIADVLGVYGVTFWIVLINATIAWFWLNGFRYRSIARSAPMAIGLTVLVLVYGVWRMKQTLLQPGPVVTVVQSNYPQSNTGEKGAPPEETLKFHYEATKAALDQHPETDLVVWSETMMPELNREFRDSLIKSEYDSLRGYARALYDTTSLLNQLCGAFKVGLITGGHYVGDWKVENNQFVTIDKRNSAYFVERSGLMSPLRFDKIHIVPFGEFIPFQQSVPWLYRLMVSLGPPDMAAYQLTPGDEDNLTVFPLRKTQDVLDLETYRFVTPICFEDIDSGLTAKMFRPGPDGKKRADVIINLTNDGWFKANEMPQHFQVAIFRSIENRVPTARSVNTGISGFIDSVGRVQQTIPAGVEGTATAKLLLDPRVTFYTRYGDVFAWLCVSATVSILALRIVSQKMGAARA